MPDGHLEHRVRNSYFRRGDPFFFAIVDTRWRRSNAARRGEFDEAGRQKRPTENWFNYLTPENISIDTEFGNIIGQAFSFGILRI